MLAFREISISVPFHNCACLLEGVSSVCYVAQHSLGCSPVVDGGFDDVCCQHHHGLCDVWSEAHYNVKQAANQLAVPQYSFVQGIVVSCLASPDA